MNPEITQEDLIAEGHTFHNMQEPDSLYWEWINKERRVLSHQIDRQAKTIAADGTVTAIVDLQEGMGQKANTLLTKVEDRPAWMKLTDELNTGKAARIAALPAGLRASMWFATHKGGE